MDPFHSRLTARPDQNRPTTPPVTTPSFSHASSWKAASVNGNGSSAGRGLQQQPQQPASSSLMSSNTMSSAPSQIAAPNGGNFRDWEGLSNTYQLSKDAARRPARAGPGGVAVVHQHVEREGSPSVAVFAEAAKRANRALLNPQAVIRGGGGGNSNSDVQPLVDHQTFLAWKRAEYARRLQCEEAGEAFVPQLLPFSKHFADVVARQGAAKGYDADASIRAFGSGVGIDVDFRRRAARTLPAQVVGTKEEIAWLQKPAIPPPAGWQGTWDTCAGHEMLLQLMAVSGATPANSPALVRHIMYPDLLSCVQRLSYGSYLVRYDRPGEPPHERYFYIKSLPLANRSQYCPFLCFAVHRKSHQALDAVPLCNVIWVTPGVHTPNLQRYLVAEGSRYIHGPYVGKARAEMLNYGAFTVWVYNGAELQPIDVVATDPLAYEMWLTLLDNCAQLNASLDLSNRVRTVQRYIEQLKTEGNLKDLKPTPKPGYFERLFGAFRPRAEDNY